MRISNLAAENEVQCVSYCSNFSILLTCDPFTVTQFPVAAHL